MLNNLLAQFGQARCFIVWAYRQFPDEPKPRKVPIGYDEHGQLGKVSAQDPVQWMTAQEAQYHAPIRHAAGVGVAITEQLGVGFIDLDGALQPDGTWSAFAMSVLARFPGAAVEISPSGKGLHIFFRYQLALVEPHRTRRKDLPGLEVYTRERFATLTGNGLIGDLNVDHTGALLQLLADYLPEKLNDRADEWTDTPYEGWRGGGTDEQIINFLLNRRPSIGAAFGSVAPFDALWTADADRLAQFFPPDGHGSRWPWNQSSADQALANHIVWATGFDCERALEIMQQSALKRDKWDREDYIRGTILRAVGNKRAEAEAKARAGSHVLYETSTGVLNPQVVDTLPSVPVALPPLPVAVPPASQAHPAPSTLPPLPSGVIPALPPSLGIPATQNNPGAAAGAGPTVFSYGLSAAGALEYVNSPAESPPGTGPASPAESPPVPLDTLVGPGGAPFNPPAGKYLLLPDMETLFANHVYVQDINKIVLPTGAMVDMSTFNNMHGGRQFQMTMDGKATKNAWEAYISNEIQRFPRVTNAFFDPRLEPHAIVERDGTAQFNTWSPVHIEMTPGDVSLFRTHLAKLWPYGVDASLLEYYLAATMQFKGVKFHWWPLLQGVEGNGKTFFSLLMKHCLGKKFVHFARAKDIDSNFNSHLYGKLMICFEDVFISESKSSVWDTIKPMITSEDQEIEAKGVDKVNRDVCYNGLMNSNHRNALRKTPNDRRIGPFFGAQQTVSDLRRDGLDGAYFKRLYDWADHEGGWAMIAHHLMHLEIPYAMNPATGLKRAPQTTSTEAAIIASRGSVEQEIIEAIDSGREGFRGGWVSSIALDNLIGQLGKTRQIPRTQRQDMLYALGYELHPSLPAGRVIETLPDNTRPLLYLKPEHPAYRLAAREATQTFTTDQGPRK